jgi:hypothetical protein
MTYFVILYFLLLILNIWFFLIRPKESLIDRITVLLQIIGVYTFTFGLLAQTGILRELEVIAKDMTSPDLFRFVRGNFIALSLMFRAESAALSPDKVNIPLSYSLEFFALILMSTFTVLLTIFYMVVVLPLSYIAYVIVSVPVNAMMTSAHDFTFSMGGSAISIKEIVTQNTVAIKNFSVGVPSFFLTLTLKITQSYRKSLFWNSLTQKIRYWFLAHIQTANILLLALQGLLILVVTFHAIGTITSLTILLPMGSKQAGEIIGVLLITILIFVVLILLYFKVRFFRKNIIKSSNKIVS